MYQAPRYSTGVPDNYWELESMRELLTASILVIVTTNLALATEAQADE